MPSCEILASDRLQLLDLEAIEKKTKNTPQNHGFIRGKPWFYPGKPRFYVENNDLSTENLYFNLAKPWVFHIFSLFFRFFSGKPWKKPGVSVFLVWKTEDPRAGLLLQLQPLAVGGGGSGHQQQDGHSRGLFVKLCFFQALLSCLVYIYI